MLIDRLDRAQWRLREAVAHIMAQVLRFGPEHVGRSQACRCKPARSPWLRPTDPAVAARQQAEREIQIALRDGDLHAQGRLSTTQSRPWTHGLDGWDLHSGHHSTITPEHWRAGRANLATGVLTMLDGQFIDIRVPRFMVLAIWPAAAAPDAEPGPDPAAGARYRTPYMDLLDRAIAENRISVRNQDKKELLVEWFRNQAVDGEPVSQNLADAMATLIRMPASQRGGAKRI
jgi:hypothetical protein